ncbi:hypothetical protein ACFQY4_06575 [Catellatospora bangladeshensis]|uniref:Uncharacterized protein n=1 Tax=Catellatospora bangladeshensis TaxID=310355 RepID=A0A8J3NMK5_9ACTN|nr:hypothetical protein [Catellatospora bangladeshensis]GIF85123.1 hypothetical protein Cba03nite_64720 [Catellatospora bangladeshensis]
MVDVDPTGGSAAVAELRFLASQGRLAATARTATPRERTALTGAAFTLAWPVVFHRLTRMNEQRRGHWTCAIAVNRLADACLDRFYDDVEAVVEDLLAHATMQIHNAEGWISGRLRAVTIDAHRRRRGARGAQQRPRLPRWLADGLGHDPWLTVLAIEILVWVGVPGTAGGLLWPLDSWAQRRVAVTGDVAGSDVRAVQRDVDRVLAVMRTKERWYADYVERPLGAKTPPTAPAFVDRNAAVVEPPALLLTEPHEVADGWLSELAALALIALRQADPCDDAAIERIVTKVFGRVDTAGAMAAAPHASDGLDALVDDRAELRRIVAAVRAVLAGG